MFQNFSYEEATETPSPAPSPAPGPTSVEATPLPLAGVGLQRLPSQREHHILQLGGTFTLMVAGAAGLGKTTFLDTLFNCQLDRAPPSTNTISIRQFELVERSFPLRFTVIDTPGFGKDIDNMYSWQPLIDYIDEQFRLFLFQQEQPDRSKMRDTRVHACVYFIIPGNLTPLDIRTMQELSRRVNLVPVVAKADTFNGAELHAFKQEVRTTLAAHDVEVCTMILDPEVMRRIAETAPFAVIGTKHMSDLADFVRGRQYPWGRAEVENPAHCDFVKLRDVLMGLHLLDFVTLTESHYENYRAKCLQDRLEQAQATMGDLVHPSFDGLEQYFLYHGITLDVMEAELHRKNPVFEVKQMRLKRKIAAIMQAQELRFREWKSELLDKQQACNLDILRLNTRHMELREYVRALEEHDGLGVLPTMQPPALWSDDLLVPLAS